jgi:hypothetical protein
VASYNGIVVKDMPFSSIQLPPKTIFQQYLSQCVPDEKNANGNITKLGSIMGSQRLGKNAFIKIAKTVTKKIGSKECVSYYYANVIDSYDFLQKIQQRLIICKEENGLSDENITLEKFNLEEMKEKLQDSLNHVKFKLQFHVRKDLNETCNSAIHCVAYSLNMPCKCKEHIINCSACVEIFLLPLEIKEMASLLGEVIKDVDWKAELLTIENVLTLISQRNKLYCAHIMRTENQKCRIAEVLKNISPLDAYVIFDFKQKTTQSYFVEHQQLYYGKKGMVIAGFCVTIGEKTIYLDVVVENKSSQDATLVIQSIETMSRFLHKRFGVERLIIQSDNASNFNNLQLHNFINLLNTAQSREEFPIIAQWLHSERQQGKTQLDAHFSFINVKKREYLESGKNVSTPQELFKALSFGGCIANTVTTLLHIKPLYLGENIAKLFRKNPKICPTLVAEFIHVEGKILCFPQSGGVPQIMNMEAESVVKLRKTVTNFPSGTVIEVDNPDRYCENIIMKTKISSTREVNVKINENKILNSSIMAAEALTTFRDSKTSSTLTTTTTTTGLDNSSRIPSNMHLEPNWAALTTANFNPPLIPEQKMIIEELSHQTADVISEKLKLAKPRNWLWKYLSNASLVKIHLAAIYSRKKRKRERVQMEDSESYQIPSLKEGRIKRNKKNAIEDDTYEPGDDIDI